MKEKNTWLGLKSALTHLETSYGRHVDELGGAACIIDPYKSKKMCSQFEFDRIRRSLLVLRHRHLPRRIKPPHVLPRLQRRPYPIVA